MPASPMISRDPRLISSYMSRTCGPCVVLAFMTSPSYSAVCSERDQNPRPRHHLLLECTHRRTASAVEAGQQTSRGRASSAACDVHRLWTYAVSWEASLGVVDSPSIAARARPSVNLRDLRDNNISTRKQLQYEAQRTP